MNKVRNYPNNNFNSRVCNMSIKTDYDAIVVGAGMAGSSAAIQLAKNGNSVLLLDRGEPIGSKNMSGGVLWGNDFAKLLGENWYDEAPVERYVIRKGLGFLSPEDSTFIDMRYPEWGRPPYNGHTVLRARFDPWLAKKATEAGADVYSGITVSELLFDEKNPKQIVGIVQNGDEFRAKVVILADGATSRLAIDHGLKPQKKTNVSPLDKRAYMLGIKEVIYLPKETLQERFNLASEKEGAAYEMVSGIHENGARVGGFLYTNKESISLGVVIELETIKEGIHTYKLYEDFKAHPWIQSMIKDGQQLEYGAHLIPHGGYHYLPKNYHGGAVLVGDAAGFLLSNGLGINGMNYAIASGIIAADSITQAIKKNNVTEKGLSIYNKSIQKSYFYKDLKRFKKVDKIMQNPRVFTKYPAMLNDVLKEMTSERGWSSTEKKTVGKPKAIRAGLRAMKKNKVSKVKLVVDGLRMRHM